MSNALFMTSTPLHSLWSLAIAAGAFPQSRCALVSIDVRNGDRDFIADAIADRLPAPFVEIRRFDPIGKKPLKKIQNARQRIAEVKAYSKQFAPDYVAVGNDRRVEFYAALAAAPGAIGAYIDDGTATYSEVAATGVTRSASMRKLANYSRSVLYGVPTEREPFIGVANAVNEAWVMLPDLVHQGLRQKPLREIRADWFHLPIVQEVCADAISRTGLDQNALRETKLLLALPHDSILRSNPGVCERLQQLLDRAHAAGECIAIKRHPRSTEMLLNISGARVIEIPSRLPLEIVAPLLTGAEVVGALTSALLYLHKLGTRIQVSTLVPASLEGHPILNTCRDVGIKILA